MNLLKLYSEIDSEKRFFKEVFEAHIYNPVRPQLNIIDGGAYEGEFSFYCLPFANKIVAIEPELAPFKRMNALVKKHGLRDVIKTYNKALASENGYRFINNEGNGGTALTSEDANNPKITKVDSITLAQIIKDNNMDTVDVLKMDMENAEYEVLTAPDFAEVAPRIKMIIGEHLGPSELILKDLGFKMDSYAENLIFTR